MVYALSGKISDITSMITHYNKANYFNFLHSQMSYKCGHCERRPEYTSLKSVVDHLEADHAGQQLCYKQLEMHGATLGWQRKNFGILAGSGVTVSEKEDTIRLGSVISDPPVRPVDLTYKVEIQSTNLDSPELVNDASVELDKPVIELNTVTENVTVEITGGSEVNASEELDKPVINLNTVTENVTLDLAGGSEVNASEELDKPVIELNTVTENVTLELTGGSEVIARWKKIIIDMPILLEKLTDQRKLGDFENYIHVVINDELPPENIAYIMFHDAVRWFKTKGNGMRYNPVSLKFWRSSYRLFHQKVLSWFGGWKNGLMNFAIPNISQLNKKAVNTHCGKDLKPGILQTMLCAFAKATPTAACKLSVDGKCIYTANYLDYFDFRLIINSQHTCISHDFLYIRIHKKYLRHIDTKDDAKLCLEITFISFLGCAKSDQYQQKIPVMGFSI